jgi:erythronate-4-phosphate dehydrogenase
MKFLADEDITQVRELFSQYGEVRLCPGRKISSSHLGDSDCLLVRSLTRVDANLLAGSRIRFVASATAGTDHIDLDFLKRKGIHFAYSPGCNARAVVEYVIAVLCNTVRNWPAKTVGIVGCGQVGRQLLYQLKQLRVSCKAYDPYLTANIIPELADFDEVINCDVVSLHTPLTMTGDFPTYHMIDKMVLLALRPKTVLINTSRGAVVDNAALLAVLEAGKELKVIADVWENEPDILLSLLENVLLGTPHIAGHSIEGKLRATTMILRAFCNWHKQEVPKCTEPEESYLLKVGADSALEDVVAKVYSPADDFTQMKQALCSQANCVGENFDNLRKNYRRRHEFRKFRVSGVAGNAVRSSLNTLGFDLD